ITVAPPVIDGSLVHEATAPYCRYFGVIDASGFVRPTRLRSPNCSSDGFSHAAAASAADSSRMPRPAFRRPLRVPPSKNAAPLADTDAPAMTVLGSAPRPLTMICREAQKLTLPAPAPISPASGRNVAPFCSAIFTCAGVRPGVPCSSNAPPPLTIGAAMLVPLKYMYASLLLPATWSCG